jgi:hypothetical protein
MSGQSDLILSRRNVEETRADRRVQPFVQAGAVVVRAQLVAAEGEMREGVGAVHEDLNALRFGQIDDPAHGCDVTRLEADVHHFDHAGARRDRRRDLLDERVVAFHRRLDLHAFEHDTFAPLPLAPSVLHARIVQRRHHDLVALLEVETEDHRLVGFGRVPRDRHLLGVAPEFLRQIAANGLDPRFEHSPHVVHGSSFENRRSRIICSSTWVGAGLHPPLFRLTIVRSRSKARWISRQ